MCSLDYDMASLNKTKFTRKYTLAQGVPYCDCHYEHNAKSVSYTHLRAHET